jgi:cobalt-zinc-cadmium efflux system membrane fusion protein
MPLADVRSCVVALAISAAAGACSRGATTEKAAPPASASRPTPDAAPGVVTLEEAAVRRLGVATAKVEVRARPATRTAGGEVVSSVGRSLVVAAPVSGIVSSVGKEFVRPGQLLKRGEPVLRLTPVATVDRDSKAQGERTVSIAEARLAAIEARVQRTEKLLEEGAASERVLEEARAELSVARADHDAALARLRMLERSPLVSDVTVTLLAPDDGSIRQLNVARDAIVAAGTPLFELVRTGALWVRVGVFVGDLRKLQQGAPASVHPLGAAPARPGVEALPAVGPPTADPLTATFDLYYTLPAETDFRSGERVAVTIAYQSPTPALVAPWSTVVHDARGDAWVYEQGRPGRYERRRVEVDRVEGTHVVFARGVRAGMELVSVGVPELFAIEFGSGR